MSSISCISGNRFILAVLLALAAYFVGMAAGPRVAGDSISSSLKNNFHV